MELPLNDPDGTCIYTNGHVGRAAFLKAVRELTGTDVPQDARDCLTEDDVEYIHFRPMSPTEARGNGLSWGVMQTTEGGYPVTAVKL